MIKLDRKTKRRIALGIALLLIIYGFVGRYMNIKMNPRLENDVSMVLLIAAFALLFSDKKKKPEEPKEPENANGTTEAIEPGDTNDTAGAEKAETVKELSEAEEDKPEQDKPEEDKLEEGSESGTDDKENKAE